MNRPHSKALLIVACVFGALLDARAAESGVREKVSQTAVFIPFDFYAGHREELGLNEAQKQTMEQIGTELREAAQKLEDERRTQTAALQKLTQQSPIDVKEAMARFDAVLKAENELKALQFRNGLLMRNTLRPEQLKQLEALAAKDGALRAAGIRAEFAERVQRLRDEIHQRTAGAPSAAIIEQIERIEESARNGRFSDAKTLLENVLREVRNESPAAEKQPSTAPAAEPETRKKE